MGQSCSIDPPTTAGKNDPFLLRSSGHVQQQQQQAANISSTQPQHFINQHQLEVKQLSLESRSPEHSSEEQIIVASTTTIPSPLQEEEEDATHRSSRAEEEGRDDDVSETASIRRRQVVVHFQELATVVHGGGSSDDDDTTQQQQQPQSQQQQSPPNLRAHVPLLNRSSHRSQLASPHRNGIILRATATSKESEPSVPSRRCSDSLPSSGQNVCFEDGGGPNPFILKSSSSYSPSRLEQVRCGGSALKRKTIYKTRCIYDSFLK